jgi:hypothetical protein
MTDSSNYYEQDPQDRESFPPERFPKNHVKYSALLKPLGWIDTIYDWFGSWPFMIRKAMLKEFDSAAPLDEYLGTDQELKQVRKLVESYCDGVDNNPFLSPVGRFLLKKNSLYQLKNRKKVLQYYHSNRTFIDSTGKLNLPVFITGLPRSGTTLLHRLMSEDPNTRAPYTFELEVAVPPMTSEINPMEDTRIKKSGATINTMSYLASGFVEKFSESHFWSATEMEESLIYTLAHNGLHQLNNATAGANYIEDFYRIEDKRPIFRYERIFFTMLDAYRPAKSHWTFKAPNYAPYFPLIFEEFPDASVVMTHRNPIITQPSICRLMESWCIAFDKDGFFDKHRFGQFQRAFIEHSLKVPFRYRKEHPEKEEQIIDCVYKELFSDPVKMVQKIYEKFNLEYTDEFEKRMKVYLKNNKQGKYGRHQYSLEEYGFNRDQLYQEYQEYMDHYGFSASEKIERPVSFDFGL